MRDWSFSMSRTIEQSTLKNPQNSIQIDLIFLVKKTPHNSIGKGSCVNTWQSWLLCYFKLIQQDIFEEYPLGTLIPFNNLWNYPFVLKIYRSMHFVGMKFVPYTQLEKVKTCLHVVFSLTFKIQYYSKYNIT